MAFSCYHGSPKEKTESEATQTLDEMLEQLRKLIIPGNFLIATLPSHLGLDFHLEENMTFWIEFYDDEISSAFVTMKIGEQILKRAYDGKRGKTKERYSDLVAEWLY